MSMTMINSVESKGNSGVSTTTSSKKVPRKICNNDQQPKSNMAAHTRNICICWDIIWGEVCLGQIRRKSVTCVRKRNTRLARPTKYKPYSQCLIINVWNNLSQSWCSWFLHSKKVQILINTVRFIEIFTIWLISNTVIKSIFIARQHPAADARYWYSNSVRPSVCPSVTRWYCMKTA